MKMEKIQSNKPLKVLSASAGSGKTYTIVLTYLELVLKDKVRFGSILAMTFTKAAALEMRERIIGALFTLSRSSDSNYSKAVSLALKMSIEEVEARSTLVLKEILHNYEDFQISTLDKFNLRLVKTFSRDLDLEEDFQTVVDASDVLDESLDNLIAKVNTPGNEIITKLILAYAETFTDKEKKWKVRDELKVIAKEFKGENNAEVIARLLQQEPFGVEVFWGYKKEIKEYREKIEQKKRELFSKIDGADLQSSFVTGIHKFFKDNALEIEGNLKKGLDNSFKTQMDEGIIALIQNVVDEVIVQHKKLLTLEFKCSCFFEIQALKLIAIELDIILRERGLLLLSDTSKMIEGLIRQEEAPYIYEKLGNRFNHFLLDEFQDTSRKQWNNLLPLVFDAIARQGKIIEVQKSLIVGDAKQSIYRFRGGEAAQFVSFPALYNPEEDSLVKQRSVYFEQQTEMSQLESNYRSLKNIVHFNNTFFELVHRSLDEAYHPFYKDVTQHAAKEEGGFVKYIEIAYEGSSDYQEDLTDDNEVLEDIRIRFTYQELRKILEQALSDGFKYGDICVLARTKVVLSVYADLLTKDGINVVSVDSLMVGNNAAVKLIVSFLKFQNDTFSKSNALLMSQLYSLVKGESITQLKSKDLFSKDSIIEADALVDFLKDPMFVLSYDNLYDAGLHAIRLFGLESSIDYFLQHLLDMLHRFDLQWVNDLSSFIELWETKGSSESVLLPESEDAIQVMTAHKSKGLEFPVVILLDQIWMNKARMAGSKFFLSDDDDIYFSTLKKTSGIPVVLAKRIIEEKEHKLDMYNLVYVACTRATQRLYFIDTLKRKASKKSKTNTEELPEPTDVNSPIMECVKTAMAQLNQTFQLRTVLAEAADIYTAQIGEETLKVEEKHKKSDEVSVFRLKKEGESLWFPSISYENREKLEENALSYERRYGNQLHALLSKIAKKISDSELQELLTKATREGIIEKENVSTLFIDLQGIIQCEAFITCYENVKIVMTEQTLLSENGESLRPDLMLQYNDNSWLILDFKTGAKDPKHKAQVQQYRNVLLKIVGEQSTIVCKLFYTTSLEIEIV
jgi:ATP-dependent exoDNAse (exonuclease V) beta subunit